jgi:hypothetical protein
VLTYIQNSEIYKAFSDCDGTLSFNIVDAWIGLLFTYIQSNEICKAFS